MCQVSTRLMENPLKIRELEVRHAHAKYIKHNITTTMEFPPLFIF